MPKDLIRLRPAGALATVVLAAALTALPVVPATAAPTTSTAAPKKATFGILPTTNGKPNGLPTLQFGATPYGTFSDQVAIVNRSDRRYTFDVYATDMVSDDSGTPALPAVGTKSIDAGSWITLGGAAASGEVTVPPHGSVLVPIAGKVPGDASPGDHVAAIVVDLPTLGKNGNLNVLLHQRVGLTTFIRVAGDARPGLAIEGLSAGYHDNWNPVGTGRATVSYRIHNTGNFVVSTTQKVTISGIFGESASIRPKAIPLLLPGATVNMTVPLSGVAPEMVMSVKVALTPEIANSAGNPGIGIEPTSASTHLWAVPWVLIGIFIGLIGLAAWFWRWRRKLRNSTGRHSRVKNGQKRRGAKPGGKPAQKQKVNA